MAACSRLARRSAVVAGVVLLVALTVGPVSKAAAANYYPISGAGSSWSAPALTQWGTDVDQYGAVVRYASTGSSQGRQAFMNGTVDFAASDIPFQAHPDDGSAPEDPTKTTPPHPFAYVPVTAGGTVFMYNLTIGGQQVTNLRLSGTNIAKIFTGVITSWDDPALLADNPNLALPKRKIVPVVRSDGSGSTAQFTLWQISQHGDLWTTYCHLTGKSGCGETSYYPTVAGMVAQAGDLGVASYVAQKYSDGAIGYVNYSYALAQNFPVAKMLNAAGYYTEPTPKNVAVSLLKAQVNTDKSAAPQDYLTQQLDGVYTDTDPRTYPLSSYSYLILPTDPNFSTDKGKTLAFFVHYSLCEGQQESENLGYSPLPVNLVQDGFDQVTKIAQPAGSTTSTDITKCHNPTITADGSNALANTDPFPPTCDKQGPSQCATGTGGAKNKPTTLSAGATGTTGGASTGGKTGTGSAAQAGTTGGGATGTGGPQGAAGTATTLTQCNADSGTCSADTSGAGGGAGPQVAASTALLAAQRGWTGTQTLMVVAALLTLALILGPGVAWHLLTRRRQE